MLKLTSDVIPSVQLVSKMNQRVTRNKLVLLNKAKM